MIYESREPSSMASQSYLLTATPDTQSTEPDRSFVSSHRVEESERELAAQ